MAPKEGRADEGLRVSYWRNGWSLCARLWGISHPGVRRDVEGALIQ